MEQNTQEKDIKKKTSEKAKNLEEVKKTKKKSDNRKKSKKIVETIMSTIVVVAFLVTGFSTYAIFRHKFKDTIIELGTSEISIESFLVSNMYNMDKAEMLTDISKIDFTKSTEFDIELSYDGKSEIVKLKIVDTTPPLVEFKDTVVEYPGYVVNADDFIIEKWDLSEMEVFATQIEDTSEYKDYIVTVTVQDIYANATSKDCILTITWLKPLVYMELGSKFSREDILVDVEKDADKISDEEIAKVNTGLLGEYEITAEYNEKEYTSKIIVQDTTPPELVLKDVTIYIDHVKVSKDSFIVSATDASGTVTTKMKTEINYKKLGKQEIVIEAEDINGNKIEKTAILTIREDKEGPKFSGLGEMNVAKHSTPDYNKGVKANDAKDGACIFSVDASGVNTSAAGTYYAVYTSKDKSGNKTTAKRRVNVAHDQADTNAKFNEFYNKYLAGKNPQGMAETIKNVIKYNSNWGGNDPVWYGLTTSSGNCYVHAVLLQKALSKAGYSNKLIWANDKSHYWNLVNSGGYWWHYDSTPGGHIVGPATDEQKASSARMAGRAFQPAN